LPVRRECLVLTAVNYDSLVAGTDNLQVDAVQISGDGTAADNAEAFFDGTGYAGTNNVIPTVTTLTNAPTNGDLTATMKASINTEADTALSDYGALKPTTAGRTLDVSATGEAGIDWANVGAPTTAVNLSATTISTSQAVASVSGNVGGSVASVVGTVGGAVASVTGNVGGSVGSVTGAVGSVTGSVGSVASGGITAASFGAGAITATAIAADAIGASELAADAATEIGTAVWANATRTLSAGTNIALAKGTGITGFTDLDAAGVATAVWNAATATYGSAGSYGLLVETNLDAKVSEAGGGSLTEAGIADAVWDEILSGHTASGSTGEALGAAGGAGDPWITNLPGSYTSGQAGYILGTNLNATVSSRASQTSVDTIDGIVDSILVDTAVIGAAGAGLTAVPWNAAWDAEVQSECADALTAYGASTLTTGNIPTAAAVASQVRTELTTELARVDVATSTRLATAGYSAPLDATATRAAVGLATANLDTQLALRTGYKLASDGLDAVVVETGLHARQALSVIAASAAGVLDGAATTSVTVKGANVATTRIAATVDADGNRSAVTLTLPS
jgi:hypothetical protein